MTNGTKYVIINTERKRKEIHTMTVKKITEMNINDTFKVEYGCYGNYTNAVIKDIRDTETDYIKEVDYTIPNYRGEEIFTQRMITVEV